MANSTLLHPDDDVVTTMKAVKKDEEITYVTEGREVSIPASEDIPPFHKASLKHQKKGDSLHKYGEVIGYATCDIKEGEHVHTHNLSDLVKREGNT